MRGSLMVTTIGCDLLDDAAVAGPPAGGRAFAEGDRSSLRLSVPLWDGSELAFPRPTVQIKHETLSRK